MLRWRDTHPYNAVHVVRIDQPLDPVRLQALIDAHLSALGLTGLVLDGARGRYEYTGGRATTQLRVIAGGEDPLRIVRSEMERELNLPFARDGRIDPFRFFAVGVGSSFYLGLVYDHFIAGGDSIVILLKGLLEHYEGKAAPGAAPSALELYPPTFRRLMLRHPWRVLRGMRRLWELPASCRRAFRPRYPGVPDPRNAIAYLRLEPPEVESFVGAARAWGVTQNDLLIAMLMQALSPLTEERRGHRRRNELAIASIINLRRDFDNGATTTFGQFLSSFRVSHKVPTGISLQQLAQDVHAETARIRQKKRYFQTLLAMQMSGAIWRYLTPESRANFHCKNYPVWAGTTPLNVNALWTEGGSDTPAPEYLRAVSTGPLAPLVVAVTTAGNVLHVGLSYRTAAFSVENIDRIAARIHQSFQNLLHESAST